jgi:hypothetical protein
MDWTQLQNAAETHNKVESRDAEGREDLLGNIFSKDSYNMEQSVHTMHIKRTTSIVSTLAAIIIISGVAATLFATNIPVLAEGNQTTAGNGGSNATSAGSSNATSAGSSNATSPAGSSGSTTTPGY